MTIEVFYFDGCPNYERLLEHLAALLEREVITAPIVLHDIQDDDQARHERSLGSPTIPVDGRDIDPGPPNAPTTASNAASTKPSPAWLECPPTSGSLRP
jgi:hypothetical protein